MTTRKIDQLRFYFDATNLPSYVHTSGLGTHALDFERGEDDKPKKLHEIAERCVRDGFWTSGLKHPTFIAPAIIACVLVFYDVEREEKQP